MNKRDFIVQGVALLGASGWSGAVLARAGALQPPAGAQAWRSLLGTGLQVRQASLQPLHLTVSDVHELQCKGDRLSQFTVQLSGPIGQPLSAGIHVLAPSRGADVAVYLEPVARAHDITYRAHFSLLA